MTLWAIVPVKPLRRGKSRLSSSLSDEERVELNRMLLERTLRTLTDLREVEEVLVVSRDPSALAIARDLGARTVQEDGAPTLNTALKRATIVAQVYASRGVLVLPADLVSASASAGGSASAIAWPALRGSDAPRIARSSTMPRPRAI